MSNFATFNAEMDFMPPTICLSSQFWIYITML